MLKHLLIAAAIALLPVAASGQKASRPDQLHIDFIDVEGGQATLFVTPVGQSLLIDTGWSGHDGRDADRIVAAARKAGLSRIDYVLITHFHEDHVGGIPQLLARIPVGTIIDHGPNRETGNPGIVANYAKLQQLIQEKSIQQLIPHVGDKLPITGITATVVSADGNVLQAPMPRAGAANPFCDASRANHPALDDSENARSLGIEINFGRLRILDLGDLTWDKELDLMCPSDRLGHIDVLVVSHHGFNQSSSPALVHQIHPRVAIMDNGATKGGSTSTLKVVSTSPGLETLWQLHFSEEAGPGDNVAEKYIANPQGSDAAFALHLDANADGSFTVLNTRTGASQFYPAHK